MRKLKKEAKKKKEKTDRAREAKRKERKTAVTLNIQQCHNGRSLQHHSECLLQGNVEEVSEADADFCQSKTTLLPEKPFAVWDFAMAREAWLGRWREEEEQVLCGGQV